MITYRNKSLKVHNIFACRCPSDGKYSHIMADSIKKFIEDGEYSRIAEIKIYGESNESLVCSIIYESKKEKCKHE